MSVRDLIPWGQPRVPLARGFGDRDPFLNLHRQVNRLFDDAFRGFGTPSLFQDGNQWPSLEISETDKEYKVSAELPGMEQKDIDVSLSNGVLSIRGEKKSETRDEERRFSERFYGSFERRIPLDDDVDEDAIKASFSNGLLTVSIPKSPAAQKGARRIPVNGG